MNETTKGTDVNQEKTQLAYDVLTNFVESRYSQWFMNLDYKRLDVEADLLDITEVSFEEFDEETMQPLEPRKVFVINPDKVIRAMNTIANGDLVMGEIQNRIYEALVEEDYLNLDAETDDCIIQVACFGTLVYG